MVERLFARREAGGALICPDLHEIPSLNKKGYGIFHCVNEVDWKAIDNSGRGRSTENVIAIRFWTVESDSLTIDEQYKRIESFPLIPSMVIRSKKSLHIYFQANEIKKVDQDYINNQPELIKTYKEVQGALARFFEGDVAIKSPNHVLRAPGYFHMKDLNEPFKVKKVIDNNVSYTLSDMKRALSKALKVENPIKPKQVKVDITKVVKDHIPNKECQKSPFFEKLDSFNQGHLLQQLSGKLNGDVISLKDNHNGSYNIIINGKSCEAWVSADGRIGSRFGGGPTVVQWVEYYNYTTKDAVNFIKTNIQELKET